MIISLLVNPATIGHWSSHGFRGLDEGRSRYVFIRRSRRRCVPSCFSHSRMLVKTGWNKALNHSDLQVSLFVIN